MNYLIPSLKLFVLIVLLALAGVGIYSLSSAAPNAPTSDKPGSETWTCSMHPQVRQNKPGNCPICGMPLVLAGSTGEHRDANPETLTLSEHALAMASVETASVQKRDLIKEIRAVGKVQYNETALATVVTRTEGYIEHLFVDYTGITVNKGDHLVEIYSPDLYVGMQELLIFRNEQSRLDLSGTRRKLNQWGVTDEQIDRVLKTGKVEDRITLYSPINGTVTEKMVVEGSHVEKGDVLYRVANLESVWVYLDIYEYELAWIQYGQQVEFTAEAYAGQKFKGIVTFISPILNDETRTVKVRVNISNADRKLKPGMYVTAAISVPVLADGNAAPTGLEGKYTCPMHPEVIEDKPGKCRICGMDLEQLPGSVKEITDEQRHVLALPVTAVLDSGRKQLVYMEKSRGRFAAVEVTLGPRAGDFYPVLKGLKAGDRVAIRGSFLLDSQFQIEGKPSLFATNGQLPVHQHGNMPGMPPDDGSAQKPVPAAAHKH
jgi:membrane fusion protein, copper/silver efflux system